MAGAPLPPSLAREGAAIRRALVADFAAVPGVRVVEPVDARFVVEPAPANVTRIIVDHARPIDLTALLRGVDLAVVVAPESDGELARIAGEVDRSGVRSLGSTVAAINLCGDKGEVAPFFDRIGVPTPPTRSFMIGDEVPRIASPSGRVVIKPPEGAGAIETFVLNAADPVLPSDAIPGPALIQPYRPGPSLSASFLVGRDRRAHLIAVGRQRIAIDVEGRVTYEGGELPIATAEVDLDPVRRAVESVSGLGGFVGVDFIATEPGGAVEVIEINPRVTTSIVGLVRLAPPGTIARVWLDCLDDGPADGFRRDAAFEAIHSTPPVRFQADGTILPAERTQG